MKAIVLITYGRSLGKLEPRYNNLFYVIKKAERAIAANPETASETNATVGDVKEALSI